MDMIAQKNRIIKKAALITLIISVIVILLYFFTSYKFFIVESGSMSPTLVINDFVVVKSQEKYKQGDVITFYDDEFGGYVTHRIIQVNENEKFITKGDANNVQDKKMVISNQIIGKVIFHSKILGILFYKYKKTTITLIIASLIFTNLSSILFRKEEN